MPRKTTKENIIHAAGALAAEHGFDSVTTRMVADRSGENIGSIHYHFGSKEDLFEAVVREAIANGCGIRAELFEGFDEHSTREEFAAGVRTMISAEINDLFRAERPAWHTPVIHQLLQRDDRLYEVFDEEVLQASSARTSRFFKLIDPELDDWDLLLRKIMMRMPIHAHADYMKTMLKLLDEESYPEAYLRRMEDLIVKQTQLMLDLPLDK